MEWEGEVCRTLEPIKLEKILKTIRRSTWDVPLKFWHNFDTVSQKKEPTFRVDSSVSLLLSDWCGGGDLNPYALRR